jgi:hypothetical protein
VFSIAAKELLEYRNIIYIFVYFYCQIKVKIMKLLRIILEFLLKTINVLFPHSRIGNIIYLIIGYLLANWDSLSDLIEKIIEIFE